MGSLKKIIKIAKSDYDTLSARGSVVKNGTTYTYDPDNVLYIVDNGLTDDYVQLGGGGGRLLSTFATSEDVSNLTNSLNQEITNRKATDPLYVDMTGMFTAGNSVGSAVHGTIVQALTTGRQLVGYVKATSWTSYFHINPSTAYTNDSTIGGYITLTFIYDMFLTNPASPWSKYFCVVYYVSTLKITSVTTAQMNNPSSLTSSGTNFIDASCAWKGMYAQATNTYINVITTDSSVATAVNLYYSGKHRYIIDYYSTLTTKPTKIFVLPSNPTDGDTYEFIKISSTVYLEFYSSSNYIKISSWARKAVRINASVNGRFTLICYTGSNKYWLLIPEIFPNGLNTPALVALGKTYNGGTLNYKYILTTVKNSPNAMYLVRTGTGTYDILTPKFSNYTSDYYMMLTGLGGGTPFNNSISYNKPCLEKIDTSVYNGYTMQRFTVSMSDDASPNDGGFMFMLYVTDYYVYTNYTAPDVFICVNDSSVF